MSFFNKGKYGRILARKIGATIARGETGYDTTQPIPEYQLPVHKTTSIVYALDEGYSDYFPTRPSDEGAGIGVIVDGELPLDAIDPESRKVIEAIQKNM